jgi:hypothetical protein
MDDPTRPPRAAACPDPLPKEWTEPDALRSATAQEVYLAAGFEAVAGWALKTGWLPVAVGGRGMVLMTPAEWETYRALCDGERLMRRVNP